MAKNDVTGLSLLQENGVLEYDAPQTNEKTQETTRGETLRLVLVVGSQFLQPIEADPLATGQRV